MAKPKKTEAQNIKALSDQLAEEQAIAVNIRDDEGELHQIVDYYAGLPSLYADPEKVQELIDDLKGELAGYMQDANIRGNLMGKKRLEDFLDASERWQATQKEAMQIAKLSDLQAAKRLDIAYAELEKEGDVLKADINIFKMNASLAGFTDKEIIQQLVKANADDAGLAAGFAKRIKSVSESAVRRERTQSEIDKYREEFPDDSDWQWITVSVNPCPDCQARAGSVLTMTEWMDMGIPGSGRTICGRFCLCQLYPLKVADEMFPTVKEFKWDLESTVLTTPKEAKVLKSS